MDRDVDVAIAAEAAALGIDPVGMVAEGEDVAVQVDRDVAGRSGSSRALRKQAVCAEPERFDVPEMIQFDGARIAGATHAARDADAGLGVDQGIEDRVDDLVVGNSVRIVDAGEAAASGNTLCHGAHREVALGPDVTKAVQRNVAAVAAAAAITLDRHLDRRQPADVVEYRDLDRQLGIREFECDGAAARSAATTDALRDDAV